MYACKTEMSSGFPDIHTSDLQIMTLPRSGFSEGQNADVTKTEKLEESGSKLCKNQKLVIV